MIDSELSQILFQLSVVWLPRNYWKTEESYRGLFWNLTFLKLNFRLFLCYLVSEE